MPDARINPHGKSEITVPAGETYSCVFLFTKTTRLDLKIDLSADGSACECYCLYALKDKDQLDLHITVNHNQPGASSTQVVRGVADEQAAVSFNGGIVVRPGAVKTEAGQLHQGILLSKDAKIKTSPVLMIAADDVKCSHGASIGELDKEQLFYLCSRGIDEPDARKMLITAFFSDILEKIPAPETRRRFCQELNIAY